MKMWLVMERGYPIVFCFILFTFSWVSSEKYTTCQLARALINQGFNRTLLPHWVCLVQNESGMKTDAVGGPNSNGSFDYGLFQINSKWWCGADGKPGGECKISCQALLDDDITISTCCALHIYRLRGFSAWNGWKKHCKGKPVPNLNKCFTDNTNFDTNNTNSGQECTTQFMQEYFINKTQTNDN